MIDTLCCQICDFIGKNNLSLSNHIRKAHNITIKEYYDTYIRQKNEGICPICGNETTFININKGYLKHCSNSCSQLDKQTQNKIKQTKLLKYGDEHYNNTEKLKQTCIKKYNVKNPAQLQEVKDKIKHTNLLRYGTTNGINKQKLKETSVKRYGVEHPSQCEEIKQKIRKSTIKNRTKFAQENNYVPVVDLISTYGHGWEMSPLGKQICIIFDGARFVSQSDVEKIKLYNQCNGSYTEYCMYNFLTENNIKFIHCDREQIKPYELDFYLPQYKIGLECNGYYHEDICFTEKNQEEYHKKKEILCKQNEIKLHFITISNISDVQKELKNLFTIT